MKYRLRRCLTAAILALALLLCAACGAEEPAAPEQPPAAEEIQPEQTLPEQEAPPAAEQAPQETPSAPEQIEEPLPAALFSFADVAEIEFCFSSGAGAWSTMLYIHEDGSFEGEYLDSDMGDLDAESYPNGTRYYNAFTGRFTEPEQVNDYTWRMQVAELSHAHAFGEELLDGFRYIYSPAYGISGAEEVYIYLPGAPLAELPEAYRGWVGYYDLTQTEETELPFYGLYNEAEGNGFSGSARRSPAELFRTELAWVESAAAELESRLQEAQTQVEMNEFSSDIYSLWDDLLNTQWSCLKRALDEETMSRLTAEQVAWIQEKEAAAAAAGAAYEGGSMQGMAISLEAAELTKQRVYVLAKYLQ